MKKSTKRFCLKLAAGFLSTTLVASVALPMQVLATNNETIRQSVISENAIPTDMDNISNWSDKIVSELNSQRTEFSKTYLLEDGSYYTVTSASPIHQLRDGIWVDIDEADSTTPQTISAANEEIATLNASETDPESNVIDTNFTSKCIGTTTYASGSVNFKSGGAFLIKPADVYEYSSNNKLVLDATISFDTTSTGQTYIYAHEVTSSWDNITQVSDVSDEQLIDYDLITNGSNNISFNITDMFSKWERGTKSQNGIALLTPQASSRKSFSATNPVISVRYIDISDNTSRFTNHSVDMGSAGILHVNDVTNTIKIEQNIIGIPLQTLAVKLTRNIYPAANTFSKVAGISSSWNYENAIHLENGFLTWTQFDGSTIKFKKGTDNNNGYQKWTPIAPGVASLNATLWISEDLAESNGLNADYTQCYIELNDTTYNFNINGKISSISEYNKSVTFTYGSIGLSRIVDAAGNKYIFNYDTYSVGVNEYTYVSEIVAKNSNNQIIKIDNEDYKVSFNNTYDSENQTITSSTTYCDGKTCHYIFDLNGRLLEFSDTEGCKVEFNYINNSSNVITGFTKYSSESAHSVVSYLNIVSENTYSRVFTNEKAETEVLRFDTNYNLITNHYKGNVVSLDYDENNIVKAYAYKDNSSDENDNIEISSDTWNNEGEINASVVDGYIKILGADGKNAILTHEVVDTIVANKTYVLEAEARTTNVQTNTDGFFGIVVTVHDPDNLAAVPEYLYYKFDNTLVCDYTNSQENFGQVRMLALKFDKDVLIDISICEYGLIGTFEIDNVKLYEADNEDTIVGLPNMDNESPVETIRDENGNIVKERIVRDNISMEQTYKYIQNGSQMTAMTDFNGLTTHYKYNPETGLLEEKGQTININDEIVSPISFEYNSSALLKKVSQTITDITETTGTGIELSAEYDYDINNRVKSVTNNGVTYSVAYDSVGNISSISKSIGNDNPSTLTNYSYDNGNVYQILYTNGSKIRYAYNDDNSVATISRYTENGDGESRLTDRYTYTYSEGELVSVFVNYPENFTDYKINYINQGYEIYNVSGDTETLVFKHQETGTKLYENHFSSLANNVSLEEIEQTKYAVVTDSLTGNSIGSSIITGTKYPNTDDATEYFINSTTTSDAFDRIISRHIVVNSETATTTKSMDFLQQYSYETIFDGNTGITTNKIASNNYVINGEQTANSNNTSYNNDASLRYVYDNKGNLQLVYYLIDGYYMLYSFYAYDEAGQVTTEHMAETGNIYQYSYNANGNLSRKYLYTEDFNFDNYSETELEALLYISADDWDNFDFSSIKNKPLTISGNPDVIFEINYTNDQVTNYTINLYDYQNPVPECTELLSIDVEYDRYGNPLTHVELDEDSGFIVSKLTWEGNLLSSAITYDASDLETPINKYIYKYDINGLRTQKTSYEYNSPTEEPTKIAQYQYIWNNGQLHSTRVLMYNNNSTEEWSITMFYDEKGTPVGYSDILGNPYYFIKDICDNVTGIVDSNGKQIATYIYDAFGSVNIQGHYGDALGNAIYALLAQYNPCTFKGYTYDYDTGLYFIEDRCYSPSWGRFIDNDKENLFIATESPVAANNTTLSSNNTVKQSFGNWVQNTDSYNLTTKSIQVNISKAFLSTTFCTIFAKQIIKQYGSFGAEVPDTVYGMTAERIASDLYAHAIGKYATNALSRVNTTWGEGWLKTTKDNTVIIHPNDPYAKVYERIWYASENIRNEALKDGIFLSF